MYFRKIANLSIADFAAVRSRNSSGYSYVTVSVDGDILPALLIAGTNKPNAGAVTGAFRSSENSSIVGWLDPVTNEPVVVAPRFLHLVPLVLPFGLVLTLVIALGFPHLLKLALWPIAGLVVVIYLLFDGGLPGVAFRLRRYRDSQSRSLQGSIHHDR